jgi:cytosol aminopeptidase
MTPTLLVENALEAVRYFGRDAEDRIEVRVRDWDWIRDEKMGCLTAVTQGSAEPPRFLELRYHGRDRDGDRDGDHTSSSPRADRGSGSGSGSDSGSGDREAFDYDYDYLLVGKGITFDTGGVSIKPSAGMGMMKGDMGGAAAVIAAFCGVARLQPPGLRLAAIVPTCENMVSGTAIKPGDVAIARSGLSVEIDNTDAEGRLVLADALDYGCERYRPRRVVDVATLTGAIAVALGTQAAGAFVHGDALWDDLESAGNVAGERFWRLPVFDDHRDMMASDVADLCNAGPRSAGSSTAAAFLREFVDLERVREWAHLDVAGVDFSDSVRGYHPKGMTGIPTRSLIRLLCDM